MRRQQGVALVLLLVMLAALTLLVTGVTGHARVDTRLTQALLQRAQAAGLMEGYAHVALRDLARAIGEGEAPAAGPFRSAYRDGDRRIAVAVYPAAAFADPNAASLEFAAQLFEYVGGVAASQAQRLAEELVAFRDGAGTDDEPLADARPRPLLVAEDLLRVPGMQRDVYEKMAPVLLVGGAAAPAPEVAREALLPALAAGDNALQADWRRQRQGRRDGTGSTGWTSTDYEVVLITAFPDGARYTSRVSARRSAIGALPYVFRRVHPVVALAAAL